MSLGVMLTGGAERPIFSIPDIPGVAARSPFHSGRVHRRGVKTLAKGRGRMWRRVSPIAPFGQEKAVSDQTEPLNRWLAIMITICHSGRMINTDRLILRRHTSQDTDAVFRLATDPAVTQFIRGLPASREEAWHRLLRHAGHWSLLGFGMFAVVERTSHRVIGEVGLADFQRGLGEDFDGTPEAAWVFSGSSHGNGFALESMAAALDWFDAQCLSSRSVCIINPSNAPSIRLAAKLGFDHYGQACYRGNDVNKYERRRPGN